MVGSSGLSTATSEFPVIVVDEIGLSRGCAAVYLGSLAEGSSRRSMASTLRSIASVSKCDYEAMPWHLLRAAHVSVIRSGLVGRGYAPSTVNKALSALRGVLRVAWRAELMTSDEHRRALDAAVAVKGSRLPAGRALSAGELAALFSVCADSTAAGSRDAAALALLYGCALRRSEAVAVLVDDLKVEMAMVTICVVGKGNKERMVYALGGGYQAVVDWLAVRGATEGPLLCPVRKGDKIEVGLGISTNAVMNRLKVRAEQAGIGACSPHDLRRTFITNALSTGGDISSVRRIAGHASVATTALYDHRDDSAAMKTAGLVHVPYMAVGESV